MNIILKQAVRRPVFTILAVVLLSLAIALSCIGVSVLASVQLQKNEISGGYTTVAIQKGIGSDLSGGDSQIENSKYFAAMDAADVAPQLERIDRCGYLSAHIPGSRSLSSSAVDPAIYNIAFDDECYSLAVFALRCEDLVIENYDGIMRYEASFTVEEIIALSEAYACFPAPDSLHIFGNTCLEDGTPPFQEGRTYLVFGAYEDYHVVKTVDGYIQVIELYEAYRYLKPFPEIMSNDPGFSFGSLISGTVDGMAYNYPVEGLLPWATEYTGTVQDFLSSEEGRVWREEILPLCELNHESAAVILTDNISSLYSFNTGDNRLLEGRFFTDEEYAQGMPVCLVSAAYAEYNGLQLGDTLEMDFYTATIMEYVNGASNNSLFSSADPGPYLQRGYMSPEDTIGFSGQYTIVGLYTGACFDFGYYQINADTILIPKMSVPNAQTYEKPGTAFLNAYVLQNGSQTAFEEYMGNQGLGGHFLYFDQEYGASEEALAAMEANARRMFFLGEGSFLLIGILFLFLNFRRIRPVVHNSRLLGIPARHIWSDIQAVLLLEIWISTLLGGTVAVLLYGRVSEAVLASSLALDLRILAGSALACFVSLLLLAAVWSTIISREKLMRAK